MYTVYKIINSANGKYYIGVHKTMNPDDSYMGSGLAVKKAIAKYGRHNFVKEILFITESKQEAYSKEAELTVDFNSASVYNMKQGGVGGFTRENSLKGNAASLKKLTREQRSQNGKSSYDSRLSKLDHRENGRKGGLANKGKPKSEEFKQKVRDTWARKQLERTSSQAVKAPTS